MLKPLTLWIIVNCGKFLEMGIQDHLTCFLRNLFAGKESACNAGDLGLIPGLRRSPGEGKGCPLEYSGLENSMGYTVHGVAKSWTWLSDLHFACFLTNLYAGKEATVRTGHATVQNWERSMSRLTLRARMGKNTGVFPCPPPGDLPDPGIEPMSLYVFCLSRQFFTTSATWEAHDVHYIPMNYFFFWSLYLWPPDPTLTHFVYLLTMSGKHQSVLCTYELKICFFCCC